MTTLKEAQKVDPARRRALHALMKKENDKAKKTVIAFAEDVPNLYALRRPTGIMDLDVDLAGGFPAGTLNIISGPEGAGKTATIFKTMAMQQRIYGDACVLGYAPIENRVDHFFIRSCGCMVAVPDRVIEQKQEELKRLKQPALTKDDIKWLKQKVGEFILVNEDTAEATLDQVLKLTATSAFNIIGIDSFSAFQTGAEERVESLGDYPQQAAAASTLTRFTHRLGPIFGGLDEPNGTTLLGVCQVRSNRERSNAPAPMQKYLPLYIPSIPYALKHFMTISLVVYPGDKIKEGTGKEKEQIGKVMRWRTDKGKVGVHEGMTGEVDYSFEGNINNYSSVFASAVKSGIFVEKNGIFSVLNHKGETIYDKAGTFEVLCSGMQDDLEFELRVRMEILKVAKKSCVYWQ